jgi:hypothetical protein
MSADRVERRHTREVPSCDEDPPPYNPAPPLSVADLARAEEALHTLLPDGLVSLYRRSNGIFDNLGQWWVVWPIDRMLEARAWLSTFPGYLDDWIPFGDDGTGDPYCFHRADESITRLSMIDGDHELFASSPADFWAKVTV